MCTLSLTWLLLAARVLVDAHMVINKPVPFNFLHGNMVQVNPLDGEAYPFPCQGRWDYVEAVTPVVAGTTTLVNFTGGAQHGGGSCQFAITYDWPPPIDKRRWKTIYTIIGGCPVSSNSGNLPSLGQQPQYAGREDADHCGNDGGDFCIRQFDVPIPKNLRNGNATFAWTWFNNMGNREMYMNCAPISISGGTDNEAYFEKLPSLFVANIPGECSMRHEMGVFNIPNPGVYGRVLEAPRMGMEGNCVVAPSPHFGSTSSSTSASATSAPTTPATHHTASHTKQCTHGSPGASSSSSSHHKSPVVTVVTHTTTVILTATVPAPSTSFQGGKRVPKTVTIFKTVTATAATSASSASLTFATVSLPE